MAITNGYASLPELKARLDITGDQQDANLESMIEAASRQIDGWTARTFYVETATRTVSAEWTGELMLDRDLITLTGIATDEDGDRVYETTWDVAHVEFDGDPPYRALYLVPNAARYFPLGRNRVQVSGTWGYATDVPHAIREACLLLAARLHKRKDAPFGIAGSADHGQMQTLPGMDPDVKQLISQYRCFGLVGV
jgi:uncharacterized phiE125 gp8 family phage protein